MNSWESILREYLRARPLFLSVLRAKEAYLYKDYLPLKKPTLDYGCGDGFFAKVAFKWGIDVGLDVKESRISQAKLQGVYKKIVTYDGKKIPFKTNSFATVVSNSVLEHVSDLEKALSEINRVLKPQGKFLTTVMAKPWEENLFGAKILGDGYKRYMRRRQVHINLLRRSAWDQKFKNAGFKIVATIGHLDAKACRLLDILHYLSVPSLISYKLFGKWKLFPWLADIIYPRNFLISQTLNNTDPDFSGALFYELEKK